MFENMLDDVVAVLILEKLISVLVKLFKDWRGLF